MKIHLILTIFLLVFVSCGRKVIYNFSAQVSNCRVSETGNCIGSYYSIISNIKVEINPNRNKISLNEGDWLEIKSWSGNSKETRVGYDVAGKREYFVVGVDGECYFMDSAGKIVKLIKKI